MNPSASYYSKPELEPAPAHHSEAGADFVAALLHRGLTCGLHRPALVSDETQLGYMELRRQVTVVAWNLARLGLAAGHRLALVLPPAVADSAAVGGAASRTFGFGAIDNAGTGGAGVPTGGAGPGSGAA